MAFFLLLFISSVIIRLGDDTVRKTCLLLLLLIVFTGCRTKSLNEVESGTNNSSGKTVKKSNKPVVKGEIKCTVEDSVFTLLLEDGQIVSYIDSVEGDLGQSPVDILNEEHLVGVTDNDEALKRMNLALKDLDGYCE